MKKPFLFVGLDEEEPANALKLAYELDEVDSSNERFGFKFNLDFFLNSFLAGNSDNLNEMLCFGRPIFADLKMWNGRRTMTSIVSHLANYGIDYTNVYSLADEPFVKAVVDSVKNKDTKILGVTVLTHYDEDYCQRMRGKSLKDAVRQDAEIAYNAGCHGVILPGTMLEDVADLEMEKLVPAVRPKWYGKTGDNYQEQEIYIEDAIEKGAN